MIEEKNNLLTSSLLRINRIKRHSHLIALMLRLIRALLIGGLTISLCAMIQPQQLIGQLSLGLLAFLVSFVVGVRRLKPIDEHSFLLSLEMKHPDTRFPAFVLKDYPIAEPAITEWQKILQSEERELGRFENRRTLSLASTLIMPLILGVFLLPGAAPSLQTALADVAKAVSRFGWGASLVVLRGATAEQPEKPYELSTSKLLELELLAQNMVEVKLVGMRSDDRQPVLELRRPRGGEKESDAGVFQSFQMMSERNGEKSDENSSVYSISFAITENIELFLPSISSGTALAAIKVRQLPIPKVRLSVVSRLEDPWPDDRPLQLRIEVEAENPLRMVRLNIHAGRRVSHELVANVVTEDKHNLVTTYSLLLEPYLESDLAEVEIVAEAVDRALPVPLVGYSQPLKLRTASAYGRYRQTLQTLRELKEHVDEGISTQKPGLPKEAEKLADQASKQAERSPFFDGLDRVQIHRFVVKVTESQVNPSVPALLELSDDLNDFLFEHEILDDRERDRDFFVAARGLSRLIEQKRDERPVTVKTVTNRISGFLDERHKRWELRVQRLPDEFKPQLWKKVGGEKPFHRALRQIADQDDKKTVQGQSDALNTLSKAVVDYRAWIEELEAKEDSFRNQEDKKRQQALASAQNVLRELQKRQDQISSSLDRAAQQQSDNLDEKWPATRMKQNTNIKATHRLEGQLRSASPRAGARVQAAVEAMNKTLSSGNDKNFVLAESASDMASRLLRQAEQATRKSQQKRQFRGRRRRVTGDSYYGQSVVGGDIEIKREYQVDRRYREDILDEVQHSEHQLEHRTLLENYLRQVIR